MPTSNKNTAKQTADLPLIEQDINYNKKRIHEVQEIKEFLDAASDFKNVKNIYKDIMTDSYMIDDSSIEKFDNSKKQNRALASNTKRDNKKLNKTVRGRKEVFELEEAY